MHLYFVNRFFYPDTSATSQLLMDLAIELTQSSKVSVVTSRLLINGQNAPLPKREAVSGVDVYRLWSTRFGRRSLWRKAFDLLSFHFSVFCFLLKTVRKEDVVVLKTDPPMLQLLNTSAVRFKGGKVVNWIQDIYPEIALRLGNFPGPNWTFQWIKAWRNRALNAAASNVVISEQMAQYLSAQAIKNINIIPNWADSEVLVPVDKDQNQLRQEWNLSDKFVVMYSGNFGRAHSFEEIFDAVCQLAEVQDIHWLFVGEGVGLEALRYSIQEKGIQNVSFKPLQPRSSLSNSLGVADLHLMSLKPGMDELLMPSKFYGILAAGRPVMFIGEPNTHLSLTIREQSIGYAVSSGDGKALTEKILLLREDNSRQSECRINARALFEKEFSKEIGINRWRDLLSGPALLSTKSDLVVKINTGVSR